MWLLLSKHIQGQYIAHCEMGLRCLDIKSFQIANEERVFSCLYNYGKLFICYNIVFYIFVCYLIFLVHHSKHQRRDNMGTKRGSFLSEKSCSQILLRYKYIHTCWFNFQLQSHKIVFYMLFCRVCYICIWLWLNTLQLLLFRLLFYSYYLRCWSVY